MTTPAWNPPPWQPAYAVDFVIRFGEDMAPTMRSVLDGLRAGRMPPEDLARETARAIARAMGATTHAYIAPVGQQPLAAVRVPVNAVDDGLIVDLRLYLNLPMTQAVDPANAQAIAATLQAIVGLPRGSIRGAEVAYLEVARENAPLLTTLNTRTLPGQKLCHFCRNPMPDYETFCQSCGGRAHS